MDFSALYSLRGDLGIESTSGKAENAIFFVIDAKHNHAAITALFLGKLVHHVCSQHGICNCIFSAHLLKYSDCKYMD